MKKLFNANYVKSFLGLTFLIFSQLFVAAQDKVVNTATHTERYWYAEPWVWVAGGIAAILLLAFLFSGRSNTTVIEKTTRTIE